MRKPRRLGPAFMRLWLAAVIAVPVAAIAVHQAKADPDATQDPPANTGQDVTNPVQRIDIRLNYTEPGASGGAAGQLNSWAMIFRYDRPVVLNKWWKLGLRIDLPVLYNNVPATDNRNGDYGVGYGDTLVQALLIRVIDKRQAFGFGTQLIMPSATGAQFGTGRWRLVPTFGYRYGLPEITPGSFALMAVRYDVSIAGKTSGPEVSASGPNISNLQLSPTLNIALPDTSFLTLYPSTDIRYDFISRSWFVPFDAQAGKLWDRRIVTSLEIGVPIYEGASPLYKFKIEGRVGFFF